MAKKSDLPRAYQDIKRSYPEFMEAFEAMGEATRRSGPLDARTAALVKLAYGITAGLEGAVHSQATRALEAGCTPDELLHTALLAAPTIGFPAMVRGRGWVLDVTQKKSKPAGRPPRTKRR